MVLLDYILLAILAYFAWWGLRKGLIRAVGGIIGLVAAIILASRFFGAAADFLAPYVGLTDNLNLAKVIAFVLLLLIINRLALLVVTFLEKGYNSVAVIPFMKFGNRLLGAAFALIEGIIVLGLIIFFASRFPFGIIVENTLTGSKVAPILLQISGIVQPLIPEAIKKIEGVI